MRSASIRRLEYQVRTLALTMGLTGLLILWGAVPATAQFGWVVGDNGTVLFTSNGGTAWGTQTSNTTADLKSISALRNGRRAWAVGDALGGSGTILRGAFDNRVPPRFVWTGVAGIPNVDLKSVYFLDGSNGFAVGKAGTILSSSNGGRTWTPVAVNTTADLYGLTFVGRSYERVLGWAVGSNGTVLTFQGQFKEGKLSGSWSAPLTLNGGNGTFRAVSAKSDATVVAYAGGDYRMGIWEFTLAKGWLPVRGPDSDLAWDLRAVHVISPSNIWFGQARRNENAINLEIKRNHNDVGSITWTNRSVTGNPPFKYVHGIASANGSTSPKVWVVGSAGHIALWDGSSWTRQDTGTQTLSRILMFDTVPSPAKLEESASPDIGIQGVTFVSLLAHGLPDGNVNSQNIAVTLASQCYGHASSTTSASSVVSAFSDSYLISFQLPGGLAPGKYYVSISDSTEGDADFESSNCSEVNVTN